MICGMAFFAFCIKDLFQTAWKTQLKANLLAIKKEF
ncbi:MAG: hypothetical protein ACJAYJ_004045 [Saprospiraceae bacterium]|jgi:hypothetical protein